MPHDQAPFLSGFFEKGYLGVDFFFILSGFILTHVYLPSVQNGSFQAHAFMIRRIARIYPLHFITLLVMAGVYFTPLQWGAQAILPPEATPIRSFFYNLLMIHGWGVDDDLSFNRPSWSISAEWFAYLCFPFIIGRLLKIRPNILLPMATGVFFYLWMWGYQAMPDRTITTLTFDFSPFRIAPEFIIGMALYLWSLNIRSLPQHMPCVFLAIFSGACLIFMYCQVWDIFIVACFIPIIFFATLTSRETKGCAWLCNDFFVWLGEISYALYMVHFPVMTIVMGSAMLVLGSAYSQHYVMFCCLSAMLMLALSMLLHKFFELPARSFLTRYLEKA